jgi:acyl dehydratase
MTDQGPDLVPQEAISVGYELEPWDFRICKEDLLEYTIVSRDPNLIHHDPDIARSAGLPDVIVQGTLKAGLLARFVTSRLGPTWRLEVFTVQYRGVDVAGETLFARARVTGVDPDGSRVEMDAWLETLNGQANTRATIVLSRLRPPASAPP